MMLAPEQSLAQVMQLMMMLLLLVWELVEESCLVLHAWCCVFCVCLTVVFRVGCFSLVGCVVELS